MDGLLDVWDRESETTKASRAVTTAGIAGYPLWRGWWVRSEQPLLQGDGREGKAKDFNGWDFGKDRERRESCQGKTTGSHNAGQAKP
jgi:hypothetical protein